MATKKRKRFNEGGSTEAQDKAAGLEASKDEKVGFFERLRMGNIDQEGSEAYNRFGAGRAKADRARAEIKPSADVYRVDSGPGSLGMSDEDKPSTNVYRVDSGPGKMSTGATKTTPTKRPAAAAAPVPTRVASSSPYRVDSGPGRMAPKAETQAYTRKMGATAEEIAKPYTRKMGATAEGAASAEPPVSSRYPENRGSAQEALRSGSAAYKRYVESRATPSKNLLGEKSYRARSDGGDVTYKKGGSVKGWGIARGARKAKIV